MSTEKNVLALLKSAEPVIRIIVSILVALNAGLQVVTSIQSAGAGQRTPNIECQTKNIPGSQK